jgi:uncharacterized membrane protein
MNVPNTPDENVSLSANAMPAHVTRNIEEIVRLDERDRQNIGIGDRVAEHVTNLTGSMLIVALHAVWFTGWILVNVTGLWTFDTFPFGFLTFVVSLEAIFLSTFVLITENRQAQQSDRRAKVDLQVNLIAEQEITKIMSLVADIHERLGLRGEHDQELEHMRKETRVGHLADAVDSASAGRPPGKGGDTATAASQGSGS